MTNNPHLHSIVLCPIITPSPPLSPVPLGQSSEIWPVHQHWPEWPAVSGQRQHQSGPDGAQHTGGMLQKMVMFFMT